MSRNTPATERIYRIHIPGVGSLLLFVWSRQDIIERVEILYISIREKNSVTQSPMRGAGIYISAGLYRAYTFLFFADRITYRETIKMITGLAHINLLVPPGTLDQAYTFYGETLGLTAAPVPQAQIGTIAW